jgi:hypothetical protein
MTTNQYIPTIENVLDTFDKATPDQMAEGLAWYHEAHELAVTLDPANPLRAAGVISAFSPQCRWDRNMQLARNAFAGDVSGHMGTVLSKVSRILVGEDVVTVLRADKTVNFALTMADPHHPTAVVVDRHAFDIAVGRVTETEAKKILKRKGVYDAFADVYRLAARERNVSPSEMQAVTWVVWRETRIRTANAMREMAAQARAAKMELVNA